MRQVKQCIPKEGTDHLQVQIRRQSLNVHEPNSLKSISQYCENIRHKQHHCHQVEELVLAALEDPKQHHSIQCDQDHASHEDDTEISIE